MIENNKKIPKKTISNFRALEVAFAIFAFFIGITFSAFVVANENIEAAGDSILLKIEQINAGNKETLKSIRKLAEELSNSNAELKTKFEEVNASNKETLKIIKGLIGDPSNDTAKL